MPDTPLIDIADLGYRIDGRAILDGVSLTASERRIGIVGRNGSGKSTLGRAICGLIPVTGRVRIAGVDVARDRRGALGAVGLLFQNPEHQIIFPTVAEELDFGLGQMRWPGPDRARAVADMLARFGRDDWADRATQDLSHGQKQLVCLMAILLMAPRLIVLDEPFAGLDIPTAMQLSRVLDGLDCALVQISHAPADLQAYDRVVWLEQGRVAEDGAPDRVLAAYEARMRALGAGDAA